MKKYFYKFLACIASRCYHGDDNTGYGEIYKMSDMDGAIKYGEVDSVDFAIYLNKKAKEQKQQVNVTKLQKWLYICYGLHLALHESQLFAERPKTWDYGPAFPRVHKTQKKNNDTLDTLLDKIDVQAFSQYDKLINTVLKYFGGWTAQKLVDWTHRPGTAWHKRIKMGERYEPMDNYDILLDFKGLVLDE